MSKNHIYKILEKKNLWYSVSLIFILIGFSLMGLRAIQHQHVLDFGIDFIGGSTINLKINSLKETYKDSPEPAVQAIEDIREDLALLGQEKSPVQINDSFDEILIKTREISNDEINAFVHAVRERFESVEILEIDFIGPSIGAELREKSLVIVLTSSLLLLLFISWRFDFWYGVAAILAIIHDALITISFASIFHLEINTAFVAAILTIIGYSLNDTIVLFDRFRENLASVDLNQFSIVSVGNMSITQTLTRSLNTSITTLLVLISLIIFGGTTIHTFCLILLIGIISGTYSSIFIAAPFLVGFGNFSKPDSN